MLIAVIMAGGAGKRFWPLSRQNKPKQFLSITSEMSMIQMTVDRLLGKILQMRRCICYHTHAHH